MYDPTKPTPYFKKTGARRTYPRRRAIKARAPPLRRITPGAIEKKFFETSVLNIGDVSAGVVLNSLLLIPQGTTDQTRIGNKITLKNVNIHGIASMDDFGTAAYGGGSLRVILFVDKQANGATAVITDILKTAAITSFRNMDQVDRFIILKDLMITVPINSANGLHTASDSTPWKISKRCSYPVHYSSTAGAITELRSYNVGLAYISDGAAVNAAIVGTARVKFTDL